MAEAVVRKAGHMVGMGEAPALSRATTEQRAEARRCLLAQGKTILFPALGPEALALRSSPSAEPSVPFLVSCAEHHLNRLEDYPLLYFPRFPRSAHLPRALCPG